MNHYRTNSLPPKSKYKIQKNSKIQNTKKKYRGKGRVNRRNNNFSVLLTNLRGYKGKAISLKKIIKKVKPSVVLMNETQLVGNMKVNIDHYDSWNKNRTKKGGGGIATAVSQLFSDCTVGVGEGENEDEYLVTRIEAFTPALNIIN